MQHRSYANGVEAWDQDGRPYRRKIAQADFTVASRILKRGGAVGLLLNWGDPQIDWVHEGRAMTVKEALRELRLIRERFEALALDDVDMRCSVWRSASDQWFLLFEADC